MPTHSLTIKPRNPAIGEIISLHKSGNSTDTIRDLLCNAYSYDSIRGVINDHVQQCDYCLDRFYAHRERKFCCISCGKKHRDQSHAERKSAIYRWVERMKTPDQEEWFLYKKAA